MNALSVVFLYFLVSIFLYIYYHGNHLNQNVFFLVRAVDLDEKSPDEDPILKKKGIWIRPNKN